MRLVCAREIWQKNENFGTAKGINDEIIEQSVHTDGPRGWPILFCVNFENFKGMN